MSTRLENPRERRLFSAMSSSEEITPKNLSIFSARNSMRNLEIQGGAFIWRFFLSNQDVSC